MAQTQPDSTAPMPPVAKRIAHVVKSPHGDRVDEYYWMRDDDPTSKRPEIIEHLNAENAYADAMLAHVNSLRDRLVTEMRARIKEDDSSVPAYDNGYWYWRRFDAGAEYPILLRQRGGPSSPNGSAPEEVVLDIPRLARPHAYYNIGATAVSPDNRWLAYAEDTVGRRIYTLRFRNLVTGELAAESITGVLADAEWAADSATVFYLRQDPQTLVRGTVFRHRLGTDPAGDMLIYDEQDPELFTGLARSASRRFLMIQLEGYDTTETRVIPLAAPATAPVVVLPRRKDVRTYADHLGDRWVLRTNEAAQNFRLVAAPDSAPDDRANWRDIVPARADAAVDAFALFERAIVIEERVEANSRIRVLPTDGRAPFTVVADEPAFSMNLAGNPDPAVLVARYTYTSMTTPTTTYDVDLASGERRLRKVQPVIGYDATKYVTERIWAPARDGQRIPVSLVYRRDRFKRDGSASLYIDGYGAYGLANDPYFSSNRVSLLDRGFVVALAHVRGGAELGQGWYEAGRLLAKQNTFNDFVDVTEHLVRERFGARDRVFASGGSAGGLLMGVIANQAGDRYRGIALHVPFVDAVTTMLDESIPLTTNEWSQWGDPRRKSHYDYMLAYSPYDNIRAQEYPAMLVTTGLWDAMVQYYEPAKYVARLRATKTDRNPLLFHVTMEAGHSGKSGRFERLAEAAREFAFFLDLAGVSD
ncbi:MAG TPA: S9 family peptidase [Burkholderiaceae bacterium]|nr:S9 family peptidase [Burkholderiaceae bacterium]